MANGAREDNRESDPRVDLAAQRTRLAWNRTLLARIRTAVSLMAAGVAFDKGIRFMHDVRATAETAWLTGTAWVHSAHFVGISLTGASTLLLAMVVWNDLRGVRVLAGTRNQNPPRVTSASVAAGPGSHVRIRGGSGPYHEQQLSVEHVTR
jgi:uncharacterized membrane protein YidH (DUF202 family)